MSKSRMRIGHGFDVHGFEKGEALILGGVSIPFSKKFKAHSDGDVLIHAVCDALLGAVALGDIGKHFPDTEKRFENINSRELLREVSALIQSKDYSIENIDITVIAQKPRLAGHVDLMKENLVQDLSLSNDQINIKATTTEGLGFVGREEGIAVHALTLLVSNFSN
jgi:2-C-methyl-D-erythritol 2,4-cyclodiphosphate synthase